ncbi:MAG: CRTAC1 family protein, partial [Gammaproteobacteria bacterium]|nr:CRTAC1 family protein [Gammaproteobacteria bacterium]
ATSITPEDSTSSRVSGGVAVSDYNADGRLDIYVTQGRNSPGRLFNLQADRSFADVTEQAGVNTESVGNGGVFFDVDLDGLPDLISVQDGPTYLQIFGNDGDGTFSDITDSTGILLTKPSFSIAAGDYDLDGDLDLFFAHWAPYTKQDRWEFFWQNQGDGTFTDVSNIADIGRFPADDSGLDLPEDMEFSFTPIFADFNQDRYPDILLASDFSSSQVLVNNSGAGLVDTTPLLVDDRAGMGAAVADYDNDGDLDWFVSAIGDTREEFLVIGLFNGNRLYQNVGAGNFANVTDFAGVRQGYWAWGSCFADFNNDGYQDLFIVNGFDGMTEEQSVSRNYENFNEDPALLYINNGDGTFTDRATELGVSHTAMGRGLVCYDYDRDGDLDMLIANSGEAPSLYRNNSFAGSNNFLNIRLHGRPDNPHAVGAQIYVSTNGQEQMRELQLGNNYISQNPVEAHFGLGTSQMVDKVRIVWPGLEASVSELTNVEANRFLVVHQPEP